LAALFLRAFFLRDFFATASSTIGTTPHRRTPAGQLVAAPPPVDCWQILVADRRSAMAEEIRAEMVANVWKVIKAAGDDVEEGDTLVILESMKMEIPVLAESDGTVTRLAVHEGDLVQEGDLIAVIE
jgi:acetyl-CoA carboxylase biotin carboxyl carrier protein